MFPLILQDWSVDTITDLALKGIFETESFDFKVMLPHSKDDADKARLRKTCCAFANSDGGFIVFGVANDKTKPLEQRLVGLPLALDFPEHFGNHPSGCSPSVFWNFRNPPLMLPNGQVIHIVHIPKSWRAPHASGDLESGWLFPKRTNKGNESMSVEEIRHSFLGFYEKRLKLQLLRSELVVIKGNAQIAYVEDEQHIGSRHGLITFDTGVMESVITDTYSITASNTELLQALMGIRQEASIANNKIRLFFSALVVPIGSKEPQVRKHNEFLKPVCEHIVSLCNTAISELDKLLNS